MKTRLLLACLLMATCLLAEPAAAQPYPAPKPGDFIAANFKFHTGEIMPAVLLHYTTIGDPTGEPVLLLHGTAGNAGTMLNAGFAGELFGPGQPLDARKYFIIIPDALGTGASAKPSDGLKAKFPRYNYDDMVLAQYRLVTEGLGIKHLRMVLGNSMGGMHAWVWGVTYPDFMDALVPMASQPTEMSARNWMLRRLLTETIRNDPSFAGGNYTSQPAGMRMANVFFGVATSGGTLAYQQLAPTRAAADKMVDERLAVAFPADANDYLLQWESSRDYNPAAKLASIKASVLAINSADDERNPPEAGTLETAMKQVRDGRVFLIPASSDTRGHGTTGLAKFWKQEVKALLESAPRRGS